MNRVTQLNDNDRERLKSKSPAVLPDNPSGRGWSASQIKAKFYEGLMLLFEWQRRSQSETNDLLNLIEEEATQAVVETVNRIINGDITVKKAYQDDYGNPIRHTYSTKKELDDLLKSLKAGEQAVLKYIREDGSRKEINSIERNLSKLLVQLTAGEMTVNKAINNADGENIIETYVRNSRIADSKTSVDTTQIATLAITKELINDLSERLINGSTETLDTLQELANAIGKASVKELGQTAIEEGLEELVSELLSPFAKTTYKGVGAFEDYKDPQLYKESLISFLGGSVGGLVAGGVQMSNRKARYTSKGIACMNDLNSIIEMREQAQNEAKKGVSANQDIISKLENRIGEKVKSYVSNMESLKTSNPEAFKNVIKVLENPGLELSSLEKELNKSTYDSLAQEI